MKRTWWHCWPALLLLLGWSRPAHGQQMCMLKTPSFYQAQGGAAQLGPIECGACSISNSNNFSGHGSCDPIAGSAVTPAYSGGSVASYAAQTAISSFMAGWQRGRELARQRAAAEAAAQAQRTQQNVQQFRLHEQRAAAAREQELADSIAAFDRAKQAAGGLLKRDSSSALTAFTPTNGETFGLKTEDADVARATADELWDQMSCRAGIDLGAVKAALGSDWREARYLSEQARRAARGETPDVACGAGVPAIGPLKCTKHTDTGDVPVPCEDSDDPVIALFAQVDSSTHARIQQLASLNESHPDVERQTADVRQKIEIKQQDAPAGCVSELCQQARAELARLQQDEKALQKVLDEKQTATDELLRNRDILQELKNNPKGVQNFLQQKGKQP